MAEVTKRVITTGDAEMDKKIGGGLPLGSLTLIEGDNDSGKSTLAQQMIWGSLNDGQKIGVFTTENTTRSFLDHMASLGFDVIDYYLLGWLKIYPLRFASERGRGLDEELESQDANILQYIGSLSEKGREVVQGVRNLLDMMSREGNEVIFIDSLTGFFSGAAVDEIVNFFESAKHQCNMGKTIVIILHAIHGHEPFLTTRIRSMCDSHLVLRTMSEMGKVLKLLEIAKVRGAQRVTGDIWGFEVMPELGIRIIPIRKVQV